jgi:hypothetical protein
MRHPDFRVRGKIFATFPHAEEDVGMVKLTSDQQCMFIRAEPKVFTPVKGGWGRQGATLVILEAATEDAVYPAMLAAWRNAAPKKLVEESRDLD